MALSYAENLFDLSSLPLNCIQSHLQSSKIGIETVTIFVTLPILISLVHRGLKWYFELKKCQLRKKSAMDWNTLPRLPILENMWIFRNKKEIIRSAVRLLKPYGPIIRSSLFGEEYAILNSPTLVEKILSSRDYGHTAKPQAMYQSIFEIFGNEVFTSKGEHWHSHRKILSKAFTYRALRKYTKIYNKCAKGLVIQLGEMFGKTDSTYHQINTQIQTCSIKVIFETVMGLDTSKSDKDTTHVLDSVDRLKEIVFERFASGWLLIPLFWKMHPLFREFKNCIKSIDTVLKKMIGHCHDECMRTSKIVSKNKSQSSFDNMMELMVQSGFSQPLILDGVKTMIIAGYETTSTAMHFLLFMLALHKNHQDSCMEEIDAIFEDKSKCPNGELTLEALSEMKCLERCLLESLRLFPIAFATGRKLDTALHIDKDLEIPPGTTVITPNLPLHRYPDHFPQPDEFQPDRFLPENCLKRHRYSYLAFSAGPRGCIGMKFAMLEAKTVVAQIIREFEVYTTDKIDDVAIIPSMVLRPERDYYFHLKKRSSDLLL